MSQAKAQMEACGGRGEQKKSVHGVLGYAATVEKAEAAWVLVRAIKRDGGSSSPNMEKRRPVGLG